MANQEKVTAQTTSQGYTYKTSTVKHVKQTNDKCIYAKTVPGNS